MAFRSAELGRLVKFNSSSSSKFLQIYEDGLDNDIEQICLRKPEPRIAPSSIRCKRRAWFRLRGCNTDAPTKPDRVLRWSADLGTAIHELVQKQCIAYFKDNWVDVPTYLKDNVHDHKYSVITHGYEARVKFTDIPISFACDGILKLDDMYYLVEFKTSDSAVFRDLVDIKDEHVSQVICYSTLLHLSRALVIYIDRAYGDMKCYERKILSYEQEQMMSDISEIIESVKYRIAPEGLPKGDKWCTSNYCPYYKLCKQYG